MRAVIFSSDGRRIAAEADRARDRSVEVWYVATTGHSAAHSASSERLGVAGSCRGRTSKRPSRRQRRGGEGTPSPPPPARGRPRAAPPGQNDPRPPEPL